MYNYKNRVGVAFRAYRIEKVYIQTMFNDNSSLVTDKNPYYITFIFKSYNTEKGK